MSDQAGIGSSVTTGRRRPDHRGCRLRRRPSLRRPAPAARCDTPVRAGAALPRTGPDVHAARTRERLRRDPAIRSSDAVRLLKLYCAGIDSSHPRLKLDVATGRTLPPTLIQAGGAGMLAADAIALADHIRTAGGECELQIWPDQVHVFQALPRLTPEAGSAMRHIAGHALRDNRLDQAPG